MSSGNVRVLCTIKSESVMTGKCHTWKTILFQEGLWGLMRVLEQTVVHSLCLGIFIDVQAASQSTFRIYRFERRHWEHTICFEARLR